jgi:hypothetical protein
MDKGVRSDPERLKGGPCLLRLLIPAAQYIRMSTEHQKFSLENQSAALRLYAEAKNFTVVKT